MDLNDQVVRTVPPRPKGYGVFGLFVGIALTGLLVWGWHFTLTSVQRDNLFLYAKSSTLSLVNPSNFSLHPSSKISRNEFVSGLLRKQVYNDQGVWMFCIWPLALGGLTTIVLIFLGAQKDAKFMLELRSGRVVSGPKLVSRAEFNADQRAQKEIPGVGLVLKNSRTPGELLKGKEGSVLRIPKRHESHHFSIAGAPGAGKTQTIMQLMDQVNDRRATDTAVVWDPTGVLTERYFDAGRGDVILNPLDARCPSWNPKWELSGTNAFDEATARAMGSSLYVGRAASTQDGTTFFSDTSIDLWTQIVAHCEIGESQDLARWMASPDPELDMRVIGSKCEQDLNKNAAPQRNGILSSFCAIQGSLSSIPTSEDAEVWTVKDWCNKRHGWLFLTSTPDTAATIRPLQSLWIDMLIRRLMAMREQPDLRAPWFFFDELAELQRLPMLEPAMNQGRKFNLRMVLGFQAMAQVEHLYGRDLAQAILAAPGVQIYMRTMEHSSAKWMSEQCGLQRLERLVESFGATWTGNSKGQSVRTELVDVALFIPSVFMGMPDMQGILRHGNSLVMVRMPHLPKIKRCLAFVGRKDVPTRLTYVEPVGDAVENNASQELAADMVAMETRGQRRKGPLQGRRAEA